MSDNPFFRESMDSWNRGKIIPIILFFLFILVLILINFVDFSNKNELLYDAIQEGNYIKSLKLIKEDGADVNAAVHDGYSLLHESVVSNEPDLVKLLIQNGAAVEVRNKYGSTPLLLAVYLGHLPNAWKVIQLLLKAGANPYVKNWKGQSALTLAASQNDLNTVQLLIRKNVDINTVSEKGQNALHLAVIDGNADLVKLLIKNKININAKDIYGNTPLDIIRSPRYIFRRDFKKIDRSLARKILIQNGAKIGARVYTKNINKPKEITYPYPVKYLNINQYKVAYLDEGQGDTILFIHGLSTNSYSFFTLYPLLLNKGYRIIAIDLLGYGKSDKPDLNYTIFSHRDVLATFMKSLKIKKVNLVGHSMGSAIGMLLSLKYKNLVNKLILLAPGGLNRIPESIIQYLRNNYNEEIGSRYENPAVAESYFKSISYFHNTYLHQFIQFRKNEMLKKNWVKTYQAIRRSFFSLLESSNFIINQVDEVSTSTLVLLAENDAIVPLEKVRNNIVRHNNDWKVKIIKKANHMIQFDQPQLVCKEIIQFISN